MRVVLDTNVLVSALWKSAGNPFALLEMVFSGRLIPCYDQRILAEYFAALHRPKLKFSGNKIEELLVRIKEQGLPVTAEPCSQLLPDESDRKFYEAAVSARAVLITGNIKHYPQKNFIVTPAEFVRGF